MEPAGKVLREQTGRKAGRLGEEAAGSGPRPAGSWRAQVGAFLPPDAARGHRNCNWKNAINQLLSVNSMFQMIFSPQNCSNYLAFGIMWASPQQPPHKPKGISTP